MFGGAYKKELESKNEALVQENERANREVAKRFGDGEIKRRQRAKYAKNR